MTLRWFNLNKIKNCLRTNGDYYFFVIAIILGLLIGIVLLHYLCISIQDVAQLLIIYATFSVLFHTIFIKDNFSKYRERPELKADFNFHEPDCHLTETFVRYLLLNDSIGLATIPTYYIRMRINNTGKTTLKNTEVILEKVKKGNKYLKTFLPLNLIWALTESQNNRGLVQIPQGTFRTADLIYIYRQTETANLVQDLHNTNRVDEMRYKTSLNSIGVCSVVKPNTLSDILPKGNYKFYLSIVSENQAPYFIKFSVVYDGGWSDNTETMFKKHLKVVLMKKGSEKSFVFKD